MTANPASQPLPLNLVSPEDYAAIVNLMGAYQHRVDDGDEEGWAALFTEDGVFAGLPENIVAGGQVAGRDALKQIVRHNIATSGGRFRHNICSLSAAYGDTRDEALARYYMIGTVSPAGAATVIVMQVDVRTHLVRTDGGWRIKRNTMTALV